MSYLLFGIAIIITILNFLDTIIIIEGSKFNEELVEGIKDSKILIKYLVIALIFVMLAVQLFTYKDYKISIIGIILDFILLGIVFNVSIHTFTKSYITENTIHLYRYLFHIKEINIIEIENINSDLVRIKGKGILTIYGYAYNINIDFKLNSKIAFSHSVLLEKLDTDKK